MKDEKKEQTSFLQAGITAAVSGATPAPLPPHLVRGKNRDNGGETELPSKKDEPASPTPVPVEEAESPQEPEPTPEIVRSHVVISLPAQPPARRINRKVPFNDQYEKRTIMLDRRITPYFDHLLESGPTKTVMANQYILKLLIDVGYQIDPDILDQPFKKPKKRT